MIKSNNEKTNLQFFLFLLLLYFLLLLLLLGAPVHVLAAVDVLRPVFELAGGAAVRHVPAAVQIGLLQAHHAPRLLLARFHLFPVLVRHLATLLVNNLLLLLLEALPHLGDAQVCCWKNY